MSCTRIAAIATLIGLGVPALAAPATAHHTHVRLQGTDARVAMYSRDGRPVRLYGQPMAYGATADASAEAFLRANAGFLGVARVDLDKQGNQPVMHEGNGIFRFTLMRYTQQRAGIPVFRGELRLMTRNQPGHPLVWANPQALRDVTAFVPDARGVDTKNVPGEAVARVTVPGVDQFLAAKLVIWAGVDEDHEAPQLAHVFVGRGGKPSELGFMNWLFVTDARTGALLHAEDQLCQLDVVGCVEGNATQGPAADICGPEKPVPMPYARVNIEDTFTYANEGGCFILPNAGTDPVTVQSPVRGQWFRVFNFGDADTVLEQTVTPPGPANFLHNESNSSEFMRAEVNAYVQANIARDFALLQNPYFPVIGTQEEFPVNVNLNGGCNAFYIPEDSINFFSATAECANYAFGPIVHHEYGHHLVHVGGSGQGEYGEGMGDTIGVLILDEPAGGLGFRRNCDESSRTADNDCRYDPNYCSTCGGEIHACGQLLSGCIWDTRVELAATEGDNARAIIANLTVNSILLHNGRRIDPSITIDFLMLDDDDGDISNGTPHYPEIAAAFGAHDMPAPIFFSCTGDVDGDGDVGIRDLLLVLSAWGNEGGVEDIDGGGTVNFSDILLLLSAWGPCPGACCFDDGTCFDAGETGCIAAGGVYQGEGSTCAGTCLGACCFLDETCSEPTAEPDCLAAGGFYRGDGSSCGSGCSLESDSCAGAEIVGDGSYQFTTVGSTTDGPALPAECDEGGGLDFEKDVWFRYAASCDGTATASVCDSNFNTRMAVYENGDCPGPFVDCSDDACGVASTRSQISFPVEAGSVYLIRIGAHGAGSVGQGTLEIGCSS